MKSRFSINQLTIGSGMLILTFLIFGIFVMVGCEEDIEQPLKKVGSQVDGTDDVVVPQDYGKAPAAQQRAGDNLSLRLFGGGVPITQGYLNLDKKLNLTPDGRHAGIDYGARKGRIVRSPIGGTLINHKDGITCIFDGSNTVILLHMKAAQWSTGQRVEKGFLIGSVDSILPGGQGKSTGPHLHIEVRKGKRTFAVGPTSQPPDTAQLTINPLDYIK
jgi:murein DD-endopeptidase MepM/ murein hydrolase activator NlpD